jgi:hypothetical protein
VFRQAKWFSIQRLSPYPSDNCRRRDVLSLCRRLDRAEQHLRLGATAYEFADRGPNSIPDTPHEHAIICCALSLLTFEDVGDRLSGFGAEASPAKAFRKGHGLANQC